MSEIIDNIKSISKPVPGFEHYTVNTDGEVFNTRTGKYIAHSISHQGYHSVRLCGENGHKRFLLHRLVLAAFVGFDPNNQVADHINNDRGNNKLSNLRWLTQSENVQRAYDQGRAKSPCAMQGKSGQQHPQSKPVAGYDKLGNKVVEFESLNLARIAGYTAADKTIYGTRPTSQGLIFKYV